MSRFDEQLQALVLNALQEDIGDGDHTTLACIPPEARGRAVLKIKQSGILAGIEIAEKILKIKEPDAVFTPLKQDGDSMKDGEDAFEAEASVHTILQCERLILNCMQRMSGIATLHPPVCRPATEIQDPGPGYPKDHSEFPSAGKRSGAYRRRHQSPVQAV